MTNTEVVESKGPSATKQKQPSDLRRDARIERMLEELTAEMKNEDAKTTRILHAKIESELLDPEKFKSFAKLAINEMRTYPMDIEDKDLRGSPGSQPVTASLKYLAGPNPWAWVGEPIDSKFFSIVLGKGIYAETWQKTRGSYQASGMSRAGLLNDQIGLGEHIGKNKLAAITEVCEYPTAEEASIENASLRMALIVGYMDFEIPADYFPGSKAHVRIAPILVMNNQDVFISKPVFFEECTQAYLKISTSLHQSPIDPVGTTWADKVFINEKNPLKDYSTTLQSPGLCQDLELTGFVDSKKPATYTVNFLQWVHLCSVGGHLQVVIENMFGKYPCGVEVPFLCLCIDDSEDKIAQIEEKIPKWYDHTGWQSIEEFARHDTD